MDGHPSWTLQSGVIPYRYRADRLEVAIITSTCGTRWGIPKGGIESEYTPEQSAAKEALEEAGLVGDVRPVCIGQFTYVKRDVMRIVQLYPLEVTIVLPYWPEMHKRRREWVGVEEAAARVAFDGLVHTFRDLHALLEHTGTVADPVPADAFPVCA